MRRFRCGKLIFILLFILLGIGQITSRRSLAFSAGPDPGRTGAPGELTCATGECHGNRRFVDNSRFFINAPASYQAGQTYPITVQHRAADTSRARWGFQITALASDHLRAGTWQSLDATTQLTEETNLNRQYAQQTASGSYAGQSGGASWTVNWIAPAVNAGPVTFFAAGNQADNNHNPSGDEIYLAQITIPFSHATPTPTPMPAPEITQLASPGFGSLLCYPLVTSAAVNAHQQNTRVTVTNTHETQIATVRLMFVNGANGAVTSYFTQLTPLQTMSLRAAEIDPGVTGYLIVMACDALTGCPVSFNYLVGEASVKWRTGHAASLPAEAFTLRDEARWCDQTQTAVTLRFDGVQLNRAARVLALSNVMSRTDGNDTWLVVNRLNGDLTANVTPLGELAGVLFDSAANQFSFMTNASACQFVAQLNDDFPRVWPPFTEAIASQRSGWIKLWASDNVALFGAAFNANATVMGFRHGHALHKLTAAPAVTLTVPISPPAL